MPASRPVLAAGFLGLALTWAGCEVDPTREEGAPAAEAPPSRPGPVDAEGTGIGEHPPTVPSTAEAQGTSGGPTRPLDLRLRVGETLRDEFVPIDALRYESAALTEFFGTMREAAEPLCRFKHGFDSRRPDVKNFVRRPGLFLNVKRGTKYMMMAGCWNFVRMNDRRPHRDFELVKALFPSATGYDCTAVGVMPPYLMHGGLGCRSLHMLDFDWQIQAIHERLLDAMQRGALSPDERDASLAELRLGWIAHRKPSPSHPGSIEALCAPAMTERCADALTRVQESVLDGAIDSVTLDLAGLHEAQFDPVPDERLRVLYLSNAVESIYTRQVEFKSFIANLASTMSEGERAVFIHHVGGYAAFGLYVLTKTADGRQLRTRCRDVYTASASNAKAPTYTTWFDAMARDGSRGIPTRRSLHSQIRADAREAERTPGAPEGDAVAGAD